MKLRRCLLDRCPVSEVSAVPVTPADLTADTVRRRLRAGRSDRVRQLAPCPGFISMCYWSRRMPPFHGASGYDTN